MMLKEIIEKMQNDIIELKNDFDDLDICTQIEEKNKCEMLEKYLPDLEKANELHEKTCKFIKKNEYDNIYYKCSNCEMYWDFADWTPKENNFNYCPFCGLKINHGRK